MGANLTMNSNSCQLYSASEIILIVLNEWCFSLPVAMAFCFLVKNNLITSDRVFLLAQGIKIIYSLASDLLSVWLCGFDFVFCY